MIPPHHVHEEASGSDRDTKSRRKKTNMNRPRKDGNDTEITEMVYRQNGEKWIVQPMDNANGLENSEIFGNIKIVATLQW